MTRNDDCPRSRECKILHPITLHDRNQAHDDLVLWGENTVLGKFNTFLGESKTYGYAVLDKIPVEHPYCYLKEKFQVGMTFPDKPAIRRKPSSGLHTSALTPDLESILHARTGQIVLQHNRGIADI